MRRRITDKQKAQMRKLIKIFLLELCDKFWVGVKDIKDELIMVSVFLTLFTIMMIASEKGGG